MIRNYFNYNENCRTNKKVEETTFVPYIIYASICSILYLSEILFAKSASEIELVHSLLV